jgi:polyferredoxin
MVELPDMPNAGDIVDADELAIPLGILLFVVTVVLTVLLASLSIVYSAPMLFAELLLDGVLAATLYRRLRRLDTRHWLQSAIRRTFVPFAITALLMMAAGWGLSTYAPTARSLGEVLATL